MKATTEKRAKSEAELLDYATNNLLHAIKQQILKKQGRVDYKNLRKSGYNDRLLTKLKQA